MPRSRVRSFVGVTVAIAAAVGVVAALVIPVRITHGAGSMRCSSFGSEGECPTELLTNQLLGTGALVLALIAPALVLFAFVGTGRFWSVARGVWVGVLILYWVVAVPLGLLMLAGTEGVES
jgi:hypothetical protein